MRPALPLLLCLVGAVGASALTGCAPRRIVEERAEVERTVRDGATTDCVTTGGDTECVTVRIADALSRGAAAIDSAVVIAGVTAALRSQEASWNEGDLRAFMNVYLRTRQTTFLSGGSVRRGWQDAYYAYRRAYPDAAAMGSLAFTELSVTPLGPETALAWGRWRLTRAEDTPGGLFSLVLQRLNGEWRIVHDHTSSE